MGRCYPMVSDNNAAHIARKEQTMRLIDADALNDAMYHEAFENDESYNEKNPMAKWDSGLWIRYKMFENAIADAPSIDIEPKRGEWIDDDFVGQYRCSECDYYAIDEYDYCPNCGALMTEREGE